MSRVKGTGHRLVGGTAAAEQAETARRYQVSWRWVHTLVTRYQAGGWEAVEAQSRRPHGNSRAVNAELRERILTLRRELQSAGTGPWPDLDRGST